MTRRRVSRNLIDRIGINRLEIALHPLRIPVIGNIPVPRPAAAESHPNVKRVQTINVQIRVINGLASHGDGEMHEAPLPLDVPGEMSSRGSKSLTSPPIREGRSLTSKLSM